MSKAKIIHVKESSKELKQLQKKQPLTIIKRLNMLIELKKNEANGLSKRQLSKLIGVDPNSIQKWRTIYINEEIKGIVTHGRIGFKPSLITKEEHKKIEHKLNQPKNALRDYKELMQWIKDELGKEIKYTNNGELTQRLTVEKLKKKHSSFPRNELVADVFYKAAYIEAWGHGTIKMVDECKKAGLPEPNFEEESGGMLVTFRKDILTEEYLQKMDLNERQIKAVLYIKEKGSVVSSVYQRINDTTSKTATRDLVDLVTKGILENKGGAIRGAIYMLKKD